MIIFESEGGWLLLTGGYREERARTAKVKSMEKAYCSRCKKTLVEVISSFECLSAWDKKERFYIPGDDCELVKRCPDCEAIVTVRDKKMRKKVNIERNPVTKRKHARPI